MPIANSIHFIFFKLKMKKKNDRPFNTKFTLGSDFHTVQASLHNNGLFTCFTRIGQKIQRNKNTTTGGYS